MKYNFDETGITGRMDRSDGNSRKAETISLEWEPQIWILPVHRVYGKYCSQSARRIHIITDSSRRVIFSL